VAAAIGTIWDKLANIACGCCYEGSFSLLPLYLGFPLGVIGLLLIYRKSYGWLPTGFLAVGLAEILYFRVAYPNGGEGWMGGFRCLS
jgi:hypothetical protein